MKNKDWLAKYIDAITITHNDKAVVVSDMDYKICYASITYLSITAAKDVIGKNMDENHPGYEYKEEIKKLAKKVEASGKTASFFVIYRFPGSDYKRCYWYQLSPIINPHTQQVVGKIGEIQEVNERYLTRILGLLNNLSNLHPRTIKKDPNYRAPNLNTREEEVLFLLTLKHSHKSIAAILSKLAKRETTVSTINSLIRQQLFKKFDVESTEELINTVIQADFIRRIPPSLLEQQEGIFMIRFCDLKY